MFMIKINHLVFLLMLKVCNGDRRIVGGSEVTTAKKYVVYLVKAHVDVQTYDAWLCGGALVSPTFIITSAACVEDVKHLYAIAGYKKYVTNENIDTDECVKKTRKKVIYTCVPKSYELDYARLDKWAYIDIALVKVESPYNPNDVAFENSCSYIPEPILINYETKYQEPGTDAMVLGWGHTELWRKPNDTRNYNQAMLRYGSTMIFDKRECKKHYSIYTNMSFVIDNYMICTLKRGNLNEMGELIHESDKNATGCLNNYNKQNADGNDYSFAPDGIPPQSCEELSHEISEENGFYDTRDGTRRDYPDHHEASDRTDHKEPSPKEPSRRANKNTHEFQGICQNDHGGPLVTWVGSHEVLIGVASVFKVDNDYKCMGPYLYTSTQCNGAFLSCILESNNNIQKHERTGKYRRDLCDSPPQQKGYDTVERHISWMNHPDGPADNERFLMRPQRPLNHRGRPGK